MLDLGTRVCSRETNIDLHFIGEIGKCLLSDERMFERHDA